SSLALHRAPVLLLSFPTRRSSDLFASRWRFGFAACDSWRARAGVLFASGVSKNGGNSRERVCVRIHGVSGGRDRIIFWIGSCRRSEEHTSELQSRLHLVCRLLLEK